VKNESVKIHWFGEQDRYAWYSVENGSGQTENMVIDMATGDSRSAAESGPYLAEFGSAGTEGGGGLTPLTRIERSSEAGGSVEIFFENRLDKTVKLLWNDGSGRRVEYGQIEAGGSLHRQTYSGHVWVLADDNGEPLAAVRAGGVSDRFELTAQTPVPEKAARRRGGRGRGEAVSPGQVSPDGAYRVDFRDHNVVLVTLANDSVAEETERVLTSDGASGHAYRGQVWWSPDSRHFCLFRIEDGERRVVTLIESSPADQLQPKKLEFDYAKPGDKLDHPRLHVFGVDGQTRHVVDESLAPHPFEVDEVNWHADGQTIRMLYNERGHQRLAILAIDVRTGLTRRIVDEASETFVDYAGKRFARFLDDSDELIWMSERSGWNHLYLIRQSTGEVIRPITSGEYVVRDVVDVDPQARTMLLAVGGFYPDQDPYHVHLIRVSLDGGDPVPLTAGDGHHTWDSAPETSPGGEYLVARYSRVDLPPVTEIRSMATGKMVAEVARADATDFVRAAGHLPRRFVAKGRDGQTDIYGLILFPNDFDPSSDKIYPVLEMIYAGPHSAHVPKSFGRQIDLRKTADLGFIVVQIDGMGTSHRSKAFHDVCWKNLADAGFPDRIAWMRAAAEQIPQMDLTRVGIWGGSAGGQNAMRALIDHGDFYHAAFADCGCHDNRMDKIWWNELWMGWPVGPHYEQQSNVTGASKVTGKLMLCVGELDTNVDPASTLQVADALIKADKDFDLLFVPGGGHGVGGGAYADRRRLDFFVRHLWGKEPRQ
jgi:dipeptidyl aminopeptidase/acylaminoacyl peptidase